MITLSFAVLALAAACFLVRVIAGPSLADRVVAIDGLVATLVVTSLVYAAQGGSTVFLMLAIVAAFIGFVGSVASARFIEERGG